MSAKGHRLHTREDVERVQRVVALLNQDISTGQVRPLVDTAVPLHAPLAEGRQSDEWERYFARMLDAIAQFDESALDAAYNDAMSL